MANKKFDFKGYLKENKLTPYSRVVIDDDSESTKSSNNSVNEAKYDTDKKKINFLKKKGNIVTFKDEIGGRSQVVITKLEKSKRNSVRVHGELGYESPWFNSIDDLIDEIDWKFMEKNH